jgi:hypothetical protein
MEFWRNQAANILENRLELHKPILYCTIQITNIIRLHGLYYTFGSRFDHSVGREHVFFRKFRGEFFLPPI